MFVPKVDYYGDINIPFFIDDNIEANVPYKINTSEIKYKIVRLFFVVASVFF